MGRNRRHQVNEEFFERWSADMAYVFGLWFADGCIRIQTVHPNKHTGPSLGYNFSITLHRRDIDLLIDVARAMSCSDYNIQKVSKSNCVQLIINSVKIVKDIMKLGGTPRKSLTAVFPVVPAEYLPDFVRGYFDGDGCITTSGKNSPNLSTCFTSGSKPFLDRLWDAIRHAIPTIGGCMVEKHGTSNFGGRSEKYYVTHAHELKFSYNDTRHLVKWMYHTPSSLCLERKRLKAATVGEPVPPFLPFDEARQYARALHLGGWNEWAKWAASSECPRDIPHNPNHTYRNSGWCGMGDWLGTKIRIMKRRSNVPVQSQQEDSAVPQHIPKNQQDFSHAVCDSGSPIGIQH